MKIVENRQKSDFQSSRRFDPTIILSQTIDILIENSRVLKEKQLDSKEYETICNQSLVLIKKAYDEFMDNCNIYDIKDPKRSIDIMIQLNSFQLELLHDLLSPCKKEDTESGTFEDRARALAKNVGPRLDDYIYLQSLNKFPGKNIATVCVGTEGGGYGFDTVYLIWEDKLGQLRYKEIQNSRDTKDYISIDKILEKNSEIVFKTSGRGYSDGWKKSISIKKSDIGIYNNVTSNDQIRSQIARLFPNSPAEKLENILQSLDANISHIKKTADYTYSGFVINFKINDVLIYAKGSSELQRLRKEAEFHKDAWTHPLMRPITPKLLGLAEDKEMGVLLTYGTENKNIVSNDDVFEYLKLRDLIFELFANSNGISLNNLKSDIYAIDVFNRALAHILMREHMAKPIYSTDPSTIILPFTGLIERAKTSPEKNIVDVLKSQSDKYNAAVSRFYENFDPKSSLSLIYFDARKENIFSSGINQSIRPVGDFGFSQPGLVAFDISRIESKNNKSYSPLYTYVCNHITKYLGIEAELTGDDEKRLKRQIEPLSIINALRTASYKLSKNRVKEAKEYLLLASKFSHL